MRRKNGRGDDAIPECKKGSKLLQPQVAKKLLHSATIPTPHDFVQKKKKELQYRGTGDYLTAQYCVLFASLSFIII
jgi:hypothetical protein